MKTTHASEFGASNPRTFATFILCSTAVFLAIFSFASTPSSGTLDETTTVLTYDAGPFNAPNQSPAGLGQVDQGPRCGSPGFQCDSYALTTNISASYLAAHPNASIKVSLYWTDTGAGQSDYDLYIYDGTNPTVNGSNAAPYQSASGANPEVASIFPIPAGTHSFSVKIVPYMTTREVVHVRMELQEGIAGTGGGVASTFGAADPDAPGVPRFMNFYAPAGSAGESFSGEFSIGYNTTTHRMMLMSSGPILRLTPPEWLASAKPECCEGMWEDVTNVNTITGLDPILWTDQNTGRTYSSNSTAGTNGSYGYTDDDGDVWNPTSFSPPNASSDHQTIGSGPYPNIAPYNVGVGATALNNPGNIVTHGHAVYYCAQTYPVGAAACQRSDTLGASYGPSSIIYNPNGSGVPFPSPTPAGVPPTNTQCSGIHGHVHVGPNGIAYVPVRDCSGNAGLVFTTDGGVSWNERVVPNSKTQAHGSDPSIAIGSNNTLYFFYVAANTDSTEGHMFVTTTTDIAAATPTWTAPVDLGASHGIKNAVFPEAVAASFGPNVTAADDARAAVGFLGTDQPGNYEGSTFPGVWYLFIATTYDHGATWNVVNASPNDPVQGKIGIWQGGGSNANRNLLDFNEVTLDEKGRILFGYDDGCVDDCISDPSTAKASYGAKMRVARQTGGKSLISFFDNTTDTTTAVLAKASCLSGSRTQAGSLLSWKTPDSGGAKITGYQILRGTASGTEALIATTSTTDPKYNDTTADPNVSPYYYKVKAVTSAGAGVDSNEISLAVVIVPPPPVESACVLPGLTELVDPAGDTSVTVINLVPTPAPAGTDLLALHLAQPYQADGIPRLVFTINTDPNPGGTGAAGSSIYVAMKMISGTTATYKGVHMTFVNPSTPVFESYTPSGSNNGSVDGRFVAAGSQKPAEPGSNYDAANGKITIIVKASDLGLAPGGVINGFVAGSSQTTDPAQVGPGLTALYDQMPNSLSYANSYTVAKVGTCSAPGWVSRRTHGTVGEFDIALPAAGNAGIECRTPGASISYSLIYSTNGIVNVAGTAALTGGTATVGTPIVGPNANQITVPLSGVTNVQSLTINLSGALDAANAPITIPSARMDVLLADTTKDKSVNSADISQTKSQSGAALSISNFRTDVNADGGTNSADISLVKSKSGTGLP